MRDSGFSILELIVALTILAMILAVVPSTLRLARTSMLVSDQLETASNAEAAQSYLRRMLGAAMPALVRNKDGQRVVAFDGQPAGILLIAEVDAGGSPTGPMAHRIELTWDPAGSRKLVLTTAAFSGDDPPAPSHSPSIVLLDRLDMFQARYFGPQPNAASGAPRWQDEWRKRRRLPDLIEITIGAGGRTSSMIVETRLRRP